MPTPHYEKGSYKGVTTGQRFGETPNGTPYIAVEFEPTQSTGANSFPETVYKREVTFYLSEKAAPYSIANLRRIGWEGERFSDLDPAKEGHDSLAGVEIDVTCDYSEKGYEDWNLAGPGVSRESDSSLPGKLDKLFGKALKSTVPKSATKKKPEDSTPPVQPDDEETPF